MAKKLTKEKNMSVCNIEGTFIINGLNLKSQKELYKLIDTMTKVMREVHPHLRFDSDVELNMDEGFIAGKYDE